MIIIGKPADVKQKIQALKECEEIWNKVLTDRDEIDTMI